MSALRRPEAYTELSQLASPLMIIGAAHTGKSELASQILTQNAKTAVFGTADPKESAFKERIALLKSHRPKSWSTWEENNNVTELIGQLDQSYSQILLDSLNQWVASRILSGTQKYSIVQLEQLICHEASTMIAALQKHSDKRIVIVSSEVAAGLTPQGQIPRLFRQMASRVNCHFANMSTSVVLLSAGIPLLIKGDDKPPLPKSPQDHRSPC